MGLHLGFGSQGSLTVGTQDRESVSFFGRQQLIGASFGNGALGKRDRETDWLASIASAGVGVRLLWPDQLA